MIKIKTMMVTFLLIIIVFLSGCIEEHREKRKSNYIYEFTINFHNESNAIILLPVPVLNGEVIEFDFSDNSLVEGNAKLEIKKSLHGYSLEIMINESKKIIFMSKIEMSGSQFKKSRLSMSEEIPNNTVEYYCWVYYNGSENGTLSLEYHREYAGYGHIIGAKSHHFDADHALQVGWHKAIVDNRIPIP